MKIRVGYVNVNNEMLVDFVFLSITEMLFNKKSIDPKMQAWIYIGGKVTECIDMSAFN